ncbi:MAG: rhomboid family intramembrane serine protease [Pseudomonadota bacterium]
MLEPDAQDWRVVFESRLPAACNDRGLVLAAANIPFRIVSDAAGAALIVPAAFSSDAAEELRLYDDENPPPIPQPKVEIPEYDALPGIFGYAVVLAIVAMLDANSAFGENWRSLGRVDGELIRSGQVWRLFTALTLHADAAHIAGNLVFGTFFGFFAGRLLGSGVAWLAIVVLGGAGNLLNTLLLESAHRSIGASTAVFAALGILAGYVWRSRFMAQDRWSYRLGPIIGGLALLMYTGTGDQNTDIGAHLMGFVAGFGGGMLLTRAADRFASQSLQRLAGASALGIVALAWLLALVAQ